MEFKSVLISLALVVGLFQSHCQAEEVFADLDYELKHDPVKTLRELKEATPKKAAQLLASSYADEKDFIGKYSKWDYLNLIELEPKYCLKGEILRRESLCRSTELAGLKLYCDFCVAHLKDYCERAATRKILDSFIEMNDKDLVIEQALEISNEVDKFIDSKGDQTETDQENVLDYCKSNKWTKRDSIDRKSSVYHCSAFIELIGELAQYEEDQMELFRYLEQRTTSKDFAKVASRCKVIVKSCYTPFAFLVKS